MPEITFTPETPSALMPAFTAYAARLSGAVDDFWEDNLLSAAPYRIRIDTHPVGFLTLQGQRRLTSFSLAPSYARQARPVFASALSALHIADAFVPTCDEPYLALCMDAQARVELQALFFTLGDIPVRPPEWPRADFALATPADTPDILDPDGAAENIRLGKYYVLRQNGRFLGQGFYNPLTLLPGYASIGLHVHPDHYRQNVGRSIMLHLTDLCREKGMIPRCGCWYRNDASHATLESAGYVLRSRMLLATFARG